MHTLAIPFTQLNHTLNESCQLDTIIGTIISGPTMKKFSLPYLQRTNDVCYLGYMITANM